MGAHTVELRGLRVLGTHGVLAEEQDRPQPFELDIDLEVWALADSLEATVDYGAAARTAADVVEGSSRRLLETLADDVAAALLADERVRQVTVVVRKLRPPVPVHLASAAVRVTRSRL
jgi:7,8-dihydroneopterin aldolase/epimerase/oxygenase